VPSIPPPLPWKALREPEPEREYLVILTYLPVRRLSRLPRFLGYVGKIKRQLDAAPDGLVGYSLLARPFSSRYWTLSAWEDVPTMGRFLRERPHLDAMERLSQDLSGFHNTRWKALGHSLPPSWDDALARPRPA
jgi:hypothetical protein